jgi:hypothetical protein
MFTAEDVTAWHGTAMSLVMAIHADHGDMFRATVADLSPSDCGAMLAILAAWVEEAWSVLVERDGITFEEFTDQAGLWLARGGR